MRSTRHTPSCSSCTEHMCTCAAGAQSPSTYRRQASAFTACPGSWASHHPIVHESSGVQDEACAAGAQHPAVWNMPAPAAARSIALEELASRGAPGAPSTPGECFDWRGKGHANACSRDLCVGANVRSAARGGCPQGRLSKRCHCHGKTLRLPCRGRGSQDPAPTPRLLRSRRFPGPVFSRRSYYNVLCTSAMWLPARPIPQWQTRTSRCPRRFGIQMVSRNTCV